MSLLDEFIARCDSVESLAEGGQKKVLAAEHPKFGSVVVKHGEYRYATSLDRITREVELLKDLDSKYYPRQHEFLIEPIQRQFLVVEERLNAVELSDVKDRFTADGPILELLKHLVRALSVIWKRSVVHRDIKPANILINPGGEPRIIDLGIARFLDDTSLTQSYAPRGPATPIYAAPEQLINRKSMINHRTDFFLLGIVILELMHGFHPFDPQHVGNKKSLVENLLSGNYVPPDSSRSKTLRMFVRSVLSPQPFKRFRTVDSLALHLNMDLQEC